MDKREVLSRLNMRAFYKSLIPSLKDNGKAEAMGLCPWHDDHHPSLSVNLDSGLWNCFTCGAGGDVFKFYQKLKGGRLPHRSEGNVNDNRKLTTCDNRILTTLIQVDDTG